MNKYTDTKFDIKLARRAAAAAIAAYREATSCSSEYAVRDLLADLMHYCDGTPSDGFSAELKAAQANYDQES